MYKVWLVDDEPLILEGLKRLISWEEHGLEIAGEFHYGAEALEGMAAGYGHILITDIRMPGMTGLQLIQTVRERGWDIKCIVLSGYDDFEYVKSSLQLGIENYLLKPVSKEELSQTLLNTVSKIESELFRSRTELEGISILKQMLLYRWVTDNISGDELERKAPMLGIDTASRFFTVAVIHLLRDEEETRETKIGDKQLLCFAADNICGEVLQELTGGLSFCDLNGNIVLLFPCMEAELDRRKAEDVIAVCRDRLRRLLKWNAFVTIGPAAAHYSKVHESYRGAMSLQEYGLFLPAGSVIQYDEMKENRASTFKGFDIDFERIDGAVASKDEEAIIAVFESVFAKLQTAEGLTPKVVRNMTIELLARFFEAVQGGKPVKEHAAADLKPVLVDLFEQRGLDQIRDWLKNVVRDTYAYMQQSDDRSSPIVKEVLRYMQDQYADNLSLKVLSDRYHINAAYLGQLFKRETGEMFSNYLNRIRVEKAKKLLATTGMKLPEISERVGYVNQIYFSRVFRKITGISPQDYKNASRL